MSFRKSPLWTRAAEKKLRKIYASDMTVKEIAGALGKGFTVGMVVSRARYFNLPHKKRVKVPEIKKGERKRLRRQYFITKKTNVVDLSPIYSDGFKAGFQGKGLSLLTARRDQCRWPIDGKAADGHAQCCGGKAVDGMPYCARHCRAAYHALPIGVKLPEAA